MIIPGKVMLFGEYAVLHGHPALVCAVERGVRVETHRAAACVIDGGHHGRCERTANGWSGAPLTFAQRLVDALPRPPAVEVRLDSSALTVDGVKLGLGSSAASTVGVARACMPDASDAEIYARAQTAHRAVQGTGSGADVAASTFGGALAYRWRLGRGDGIAAGDGFGVVDRLPATRTTLQLAWAGQPASTPALVGRVQRWAAAQPRAHSEMMGAIGVAAAAAIDAWRVAADLRPAARRTVEVLEALGQASGAPIVTPVHRALARQVADLGVVVKPTGAGGGDLAWIVGADAAAEAAANARLATAGHQTFALAIV